MRRPTRPARTAKLANFWDVPVALQEETKASKGLAYNMFMKNPDKTPFGADAVGA